MVRTHSGSSPIRFDTSRILAYSTAIALHALAAGLLLIPLSQAPIRSDAVRQEPRSRTTRSAASQATCVGLFCQYNRSLLSV